MTWSDSGNLKTDGRGITYTHDGNQRLIRANKSAGNVLDNRYDGDSLLIEEIKSVAVFTINHQITCGEHTRYVKALI